MFWPVPIINRVLGYWTVNETLVRHVLFNATTNSSPTLYADYYYFEDAILPIFFSLFYFNDAGARFFFSFLEKETKIGSGGGCDLDALEIFSFKLFLARIFHRFSSRREEKSLGAKFRRRSERLDQTRG